MDLLINSEINLIHNITIYLQSEDLISFGLTSTSIYKILLNQLVNLQKEHALYHQCTSEMEETWDMLLPVAQCKARISTQASEGRDIQCSIYPGKIHFLNIVYIHNPRDVDIYSWFLDGQEKGKSFW